MLKLLKLMLEKSQRMQQLLPHYLALMVKFLPQLRLMLLLL
jgi:hypothetical protein